MPHFAPTNGYVGAQQAAFALLPDLISRHSPGMALPVVDNYWGGGEILYVRAAATIPMGAICSILPTLVAGAYRWDASPVANLANLGRAVGIAMTSATVGQFTWLMICGLCPVASAATVAADSAFGIVAAGVAGANSAGKQILNSRIVAPATTTVIKAGCVANAGSNQLSVPNDDGWFIGVYLSGTGIAATTSVVDISADGRTVTLSAVTTAAVNSAVTGTYNNGVIFYNVAKVNRPFAQGAIT